MFIYTNSFGKVYSTELIVQGERPVNLGIYLFSASLPIFYSNGKEILSHYVFMTGGKEKYKIKQFQQLFNYENNCCCVDECGERNLVTDKNETCPICHWLKCSQGHCRKDYFTTKHPHYPYNEYDLLYINESNEIVYFLPFNSSGTRVYGKEQTRFKESEMKYIVNNDFLIAIDILTKNKIPFSLKRVPTPLGNEELTICWIDEHFNYANAANNLMISNGLYNLKLVEPYYGY